MNTRKHDSRDNGNELAARLRQYRRDRLLTIEQISNMARISTGTVRNILNCRFPRRQELVIAKLLRAFPDLMKESR